MQVSAWDNVYLRCNVTPSGQSNAWDNDLEAYHFTCIDGDNKNDFVLKIDGSAIHSGELQFRPNIWGKGQLHPYGTDNAAVNTSGTYNNGYDAYKTDGNNYFTIAQNSSATAIYIRVTWLKSDNNHTFRISAFVADKVFHIAYYNTYHEYWTGGVNAYAYHNDMPLIGAWPGTQMSASSADNYTTTITGATGSKIVFSDKNNSGNKTEDKVLVNNGVYNFDGRVETVNVSAGALGKSTFSSKYPLDFTGITTVKAYRITSASAGVLGLEQVMGSVPAGIGLYIEGNLGASFDVPTCAVTYPTTSMLTPGTGAAVSATESEGTITNFILTNKTTTNASAPLKFYKANGNTVPVGKAYLQIPTANVGSRDFFWFDNEATEIKTIDNGPLTIDANAPMYNLAGQRVSKNYKGVVIVNGKKVVLK